MATSGDSRSTYKYEPLDLSRRQIRLMTLKRSSFSGGTIACCLEIFDVETAPSYVALSYTWGPPAPTRNILVNGSVFEVRQNLYDFLLNYRNDRNNAHYIWIDQICISQAHAGERSHQVQQMSSIYIGCMHAIIWLGEGSKDVARSFMTTPTQHLACILLRNDYFQRLWIIQEIFLSPKARILCGRVWLRMEKLIRAVQGQGEEQLTPLEFIDFILIDAALWRSKLMPLEVCLGKYADHECQDPRDKVYGLLSLIDEKHRVVVDYAKSVEDVFLDVALILYKTSWRRERLGSCNWLMTLSRQMGLEEHGQSLFRFLGGLDNIEQGYGYVHKLWFEEVWLDGLKYYGRIEYNRWWYSNEDCRRIDPFDGSFP